MALKKEYKGESDVTVPNAYHRVVAMKINAKDSLINFEVAIYKDKQASQDDKKVVDHKNIIISNGTPTDPIGSDFTDFMTQTIPQIAVGMKLKDILIQAFYKWVKTHDTYYSDAEDV